MRGRPRNPRKPTEPKPDASEEFSLDTAKQQARYYDVTVRTVMNWKSKGAPITKPREMLDWWRRTKIGEAVNPGILAALHRLPRLSADGVVTAIQVSSAELVHEAPRPTQAVAVDLALVGFDATHQRMLEEEARLYARIRTAESAGADGMFEADSLRPAWVRLSEALGQADTRQIRNAIQRGDLVHRTKVEQEFAKLLRSFPDVVRYELKSLRTTIEPAPPAAVWEAKVDKALDSLFRALPDKLLAAQ